MTDLGTVAPATPIHLGGNVVYPFPLAEGGWLVIDAGPDLKGAWDYLEAQLRVLGASPRDVRAVVVTHGHADHAGLASRWAAEGARVLAGGLDVDTLRAGADGQLATHPARRAELERHGCPSNVLAAIEARRAARPALPWRGCESIEAVSDGTTFDLAADGRLRVVAAPGHTPGNLVLVLESSDGGATELYSGDTLLPDTIPTPGLHFARRGDAGLGARVPTLPSFLASVAQLKRLGAGRVWPGHGPPSEAARLIERFFAHHTRRSRQVLGLLERQPDSAFGLARRMFPRLPDDRLGQAMTEVIGHLDVLTDRGAATFEVHDDGVLVAQLV